MLHALRLSAALALLIVLTPTITARAAGPSPFDQFELPAAWEARFWSDPDTKILFKLSSRALIDLIPQQAGLRFARCPSCLVDESTDALFWSASKPESMTCSRCGHSFPSDKIPEKKDGKVPEETVEVLPGTFHHYPYQAIAADLQKYPEERVYLDAKRDYEKREALTKAALYAAIRYHKAKSQKTLADPALTRFAAIVILRFAQVYPTYATHLDQIGQPKFLQRADLAPPYRRGFRTAKWEWTASLDVPLNLVTAYALIRDEPIWTEVAQLLNDPNPKRTIEHGFFRASAIYVSKQPDDHDELSLQAYRGLFAVGRLLGDSALTSEATIRLKLFSDFAFYHDGYWRQGTANSHRRVVQLFDGWIERLARGQIEAPDIPGLGSTKSASSSSVPLLDLIHDANATILTDARPTSDIQQVSWPKIDLPAMTRKAGLLGGVGLARLSVGSATDGLDIELRGLGNYGSNPVPRQSLRVAVGGRMVLDDLDEQPATADGWDLATASHNTVIIDGLNQRETPLDARKRAENGDFLYFAADPDFQVAALDDPRAYPSSSTRYRQIIVACSSETTRYGVSVFQVHGGLQHDQIYHGPIGLVDRWTSSVGLTATRETLLPRSIPYLPNTRAEDGRWFVQAYAEFRRILQGQATEPFTATLSPQGRPGLRLHLLGEMPIQVLSTLTPDPTQSSTPSLAAEAGTGRASLLLRRRSDDGSTLKTTFVTVFDPVGTPGSLLRAGRVASSPDTVVLYFQTKEGDEHLVINLRPGTLQTVTLSDGKRVTSDGLATRVRANCLQLAGGSQATSDTSVTIPRLTGQVVGVGRVPGASGRGWFDVEPRGASITGVEGRTLLIRHGDGPIHGWTISKSESLDKYRVRLHVKEEPGFLIEASTGDARYYQFPRSVQSGPHAFTICGMVRAEIVVR